MNLETLNKLINNQDYLEFIKKNLNANTNALRLKKFNDVSFDSKFAILQIDCKQRIKKKLPEIFDNYLFLFPSILSTEQCTAETIAKFHASLISSNDSVLDLTAGLCIDAYYISKNAKNVTAIEINEETAIVSKFNMQNFTKNVSVINEDCVEYISNCTDKFNIIFIDPARRGENNKRLFGFADCLPNILELIPTLKKISNTLYIKASPMIDISQSILELNNSVSEIWILGLNNECKELLFKVELNSNDNFIPNIHTINFEKDKTQKLSLKNTTNEHLTNFGKPIIGGYLYEPNRCIMKAQIFNALEAEYNITPLHSNSHLFISENLIVDFPGRSFIITEIIPFKNKEIKTIKNKHPQINVSVRNFKLSAEELKKKLKVVDGGETYLFGTTDNENNAILILCRKV